MFNEQKQRANTEDERKDSTKIYLQVDNNANDEAEIDIVNIAVNMGKKKKLYKYLFLAAVIVGIAAGCVKIFIGQIMKTDCYAQAVITLQFDGIEDGLDPNGAAFDINKLKSPTVIDSALESLGETGVSTETVRQNITIEGVIPEDAVERITVIKEMALEDASNYEKILDVSYFPSQYVVTLNQKRGMSQAQTRDILNAVLESYKEYFLDTYANTDVLTVTSNLIEYENYDYAEAVDMMEQQIELMQSYVNERMVQAPDFRSSTTGLSFGDIASSLDTIEQIDMVNISSYIESTSITKDKERLVEYYKYRIKKYDMDITELESKIATVQSTIDSYEKDPVVIVSNQESTQEISQKNEYYDELVQQKIDLTSELAEVNTNINKLYALLNGLVSSTNSSTQAEHEYAEEKLAAVAETLSKWVTLIEDTTQEYYNTTLFSNAVKVSVPAQYKAAGGLTSMAKTFIICIAVMVFLVLIVWCIDGLRMEIGYMRNKNKNR